MEAETRDEFWRPVGNLTAVEVINTFGELQGALANHAETVLLTLKSDERQALQFVMPQLVSLGRSEEDVLVHRTVPYRDLVSSPELDHRQKAGAEALVDRLLQTRFFTRITSLAWIRAGAHLVSG